MNQIGVNIFSQLLTRQHIHAAMEGKKVQIDRDAVLRMLADFKPPSDAAANLADELAKIQSMAQSTLGGRERETVSQFIETMASLDAAIGRHRQAEAKTQDEAGAPETSDLPEAKPRSEIDEVLNALTERFMSDPRAFISNMDAELSEAQEKILRLVPAEHAEYVNRFVDWLRSTTFVGIVRACIAVLQHIKRYVSKRDHAMFDVIQELLALPPEVANIRQSFEAAMQEGSQEYEAFWTIMKFMTAQSETIARIEDDMFESIIEEVLNFMPALVQAGEGGFSSLPEELRMMF